MHFDQNWMEIDIEEIESVRKGERKKVAAGQELNCGFGPLPVSPNIFCVCSQV